MVVVMAMVLGRQSHSLTPSIVDRRARVVSLQLTTPAAVPEMPRDRPVSTAQVGVVIRTIGRSLDGTSKRTKTQSTWSRETIQTILGLLAEGGQPSVVPRKHQDIGRMQETPSMPCCTHSECPAEELQTAPADTELPFHPWEHQKKNLHKKETCRVLSSY